MRSFLLGVLGGVAVLLVAALTFPLLQRGGASDNHTIEQVAASMAAMGFDPSEATPTGETPFASIGPKLGRSRAVASGSFSATAYVLEYASA